MAEESEETIGQEAYTLARTWVLGQVVHLEQEERRLRDLVPFYTLTAQQARWLRGRRGYAASDADDDVLRISADRLREARANIAMAALLAPKLRALADALGPGGADG